MKQLKLFLYLLQLQEYQTERYRDWLKINAIEDLKENKNHLRWTLRIWLTISISFFLSLIIGQKKAVALTNEILKPFFKIGEELLVFLAKRKLNGYKIPDRIVITGSYGKTTFKEMLSWVLESNYSIFKTPENINTRLGIALLILRTLKKRPRILIIEAAAYQPGEIKAICQLIKPNWGVITALGWMHLERFKTFAALRATKMELVPFIRNKTNLFLPFRNHQMIDFEKTISQIAKQMKIPQEKVKSRLKGFASPSRRLSTKPIAPKVILLDDSYNSNPLGFRRALAQLATFKDHQKIVVTPGMIELGAKQAVLNQELAKEASKIADVLVIVGQTNKRALQKGAQGIITIFQNKDEQIEYVLSPYLRPPSVILLENELPDHYF